jgi:hypothetical protein
VSEVVEFGRIDGAVGCPVNNLLGPLCARS